MYCSVGKDSLTLIIKKRISSFLQAFGLAALSAIALLSSSAALAQTPQIIEVQVGDTFASIARPLADNAASWRKLYRPSMSGLANPNIVVPGMRFELVSDANGQKYLRRLKGRDAALRMQAAQQAAASAPVAATAAASAPAVAALPAPVVTKKDNTLVVGVLPNVSASILAPQYEYLKRYLERVSGSKVSIVIPPNFKAMFDNTMNGEYDIAITAPHFARVTQADRNMTPLSIYEPRINALFITPIETTITKASDIKGKTIAFANPTSLVAMFGRQWLLGSHNLEAGKDYEVRAARTDMGVGRALLTGEAAAAIMSNGEFRSLPQAESVRLKIAEVFTTIPNFVVVAHPRLGRERQAAIRGHLRAFFADKEDGAAFAAATNLKGIVDADEAQLRELDAYNAQTRQIMGMPK